MIASHPSNDGIHRHMPGEQEGSFWVTAMTHPNDAQHDESPFETVERLVEEERAPTPPSNGQYQVLPEERDAPTRSAEEHFHWKAKPFMWSDDGCGWAILALIPCAIVHFAFDWSFGNSFALWMLLFIVGMLLAYWSHCSEQAERARAFRRRQGEQAAAFRRNWLQARQMEAWELTQRAAGALTSAAPLATTLPAAFEAARGWLQKAEAEFQERAFGPFWDAIEKAAYNLEEFREGVATANRHADTFYRALQGRRHSFPSFSPRPEAIPDPTPVLEDLKRLVRKGQTDFQFANIWEHRRTREVLIAGFRTLEDGISNLGDAVCSAMSDLQSTLSSGLAEIVEQQISLRETVEAQGEEQIRMLDDIRRGEKPW